jgi:hypothetical protein
VDANFVVVDQLRCSESHFEVHATADVGAVGVLNGGPDFLNNTPSRSRCCVTCPRRVDNENVNHTAEGVRRRDDVGGGDEVAGWDAWLTR